MTQIVSNLVDVYPYRLTSGYPDYLLLRQRWPERRRLPGIVHPELAREIPVSWRVR